MRPLCFFAALMIATPALAQEPSGCDKFKWPLERERTMLSNAAALAANGAIAQPLAAAYKVALTPYQSAKLPLEPSRAPKLGTIAAAVTVAAVPKAGTYKFTLSDGVWIDVFQDNKEVKEGAFRGVPDCAGLRKSVKFDLTAAPFTVVLSGATAASVALVITPD